MQPSATVSVFRATINRQNAQNSTGPRTDQGKQRASRNSLRHGLTARTGVLPSEDPAAFEQHRQNFLDQYQPANAIETQLVQELADTSWRLNRIPRLEAQLLTEADEADSNPRSTIDQLSILGLYSSRLSRQFQIALDKLQEIQDERRREERHRLRDAADLLELHKHKGIPWQPSDHGFVFSKDQVERFSERLMRQNEARHVGAVRFDVSPQLARAYLSSHGL